MEKAPSTAIYLDVRNPRKDGTLPLKLRVTYKRKQRYFATGYSISREDYEKMNGPRPRGQLKEMKMTLMRVEEEARGIIQQIESFSFPAFEKHFLEDRTAKGSRNSLEAMYVYADKLKGEGRIRSGESYAAAANSLRRFYKRSNLSYEAIDVRFLHAYEKWMEKQGNSTTTTGIYLRSLRAILNQAIREGLMEAKDYPFGKGKYVIPQGRNVKKALTLEDVQKIYAYKPETESEEKYRDFWLFSYLCNGMNVADMAQLTYANLQDDQLVFIRAKTRRTRRQNQQPIVIPFLPQAKAILNRWGLPKESGDSYLLPILKPGMTDAQQIAAIRQEIKQINKYMRRIGERLGIEKDITTYTARHTFSTVLKRAGVSIAFISESLGHSSLATTERYLDSFQDTQKREIANKLLDFDKE